LIFKRMIEIKTDFESTREARISVSGQLDMDSSDDLREILLDAAERDFQRLTVDLDGVDFIDSSGVATLVDALQSMNEKGGQLKLINVNDHVHNVFEIANLLEVFQLD